MAIQGVIRVWAIDSRGAAGGAKAHCRHCGKPITWFTTVKNSAKLAIDGHDPRPLYSERDLETRKYMEIHGRETVHFSTCTKRPEARP